MANALTTFGKRIGNSILNRTERIVGSKALAAAGRGGERFMNNKALMIGAGVATFAAGAGSVAGPAAMDATMATAFGDEQADRAFVGQDLSLRYFMGRATGGVLGGIAQATAPGDFLAMSPQYGVPADIAGGALKGAVMGGFAAGPLGATIGGMAGGLGGPIDYFRDNRTFTTQSPFRSSGNIANQLNASGDIVLGMHNSRRGY